MRINGHLLFAGCLSLGASAQRMKPRGLESFSEMIQSRVSPFVEIAALLTIRFLSRNPVELTLPRAITNEPERAHFNVMSPPLTISEFCSCPSISTEPAENIISDDQSPPNIR